MVELRDYDGQRKGFTTGDILNRKSISIDITDPLSGDTGFFWFDRSEWELRVYDGRRKCFTGGVVRKSFDQAVIIDRYYDIIDLLSGGTAFLSQIHWLKENQRETVTTKIGGLSSSD